MVIRSSALLAATLIFATVCFGQTAPDSQAQSAAPPPGAVILQTKAQLVVLDVVVQDDQGNPVHGLKTANFELTEGKASQKIRTAEEHTPPTVPANLPDPGKMPPGFFTNFTPVPPGTTLNVLLLDSLNTPMMYQTWIRDQLKKYVHQAPPGQRIAIFGLTDHLILLQGFTSDPEILKNIVDHKLSAKASALLNDPVGSGSNTTSFAETLAGTPAAASVAQFEEEQHAVQIELRVQTALDAFNALAHYLSGFPGRKNLLWFSGSFPTGAFANPATPNLLNARDNDNEIKETAAAFAASQVAIYPIDARGLMTDPSFNASNSNVSLTASNSRATVNDANAFFSSQAEEHATMESLATETGGHAYYNTNGITQAVQEALHAGSNYYTLTYTPTDHNWNGNFRSIHVKLVDGPSNTKLTYRSGYFALPPKQPKKIDAAALNSGAEPPDTHHDLAYKRAALTRGAPTPQDVLFKVRVLPASAALETKLAPGNLLDPATPAKGPYHRYDLDFALLPTELTLTKEANGSHTGQVKFTAYAYDPDGHLLVAVHRGFSLSLNPDLYTKFMKAALQCHMEISVPEKVDGYLRLAVQDIPSDRFGAVEVPASAVGHLAPPSYGPSAAKTPAP